MKRVLFVAPSAYPMGGVQTWLDCMAAGLPAQGWDVQVALASGRWHDVREYQRVHAGLRIVALENPTGSREGRVRSIAAALQAQRPDVVVGVNMPDTYAAAERVRDSGVELRTVMSLHALQPNLYDDVAAFAPGLDALVCTNRLAAALGSRHGVPAHKVLYAPYGVPVPVPARREAADRPLEIAYVGRIEQWQKRVLDIPAIVDRLHTQGTRFRLRIAGAGPQDAELRHMLAAHERAGRIDWLGPLAADQVAAQVYRSADVLLLTSNWETGPIVAWEAMAHGMVLASTRYVGSGAEGALVDGDNCVLFPAGDTAAAAHALTRLTDARLRNALALGGRRRVEQRYSVDASVRAWASAFEQVAAMPVRRPQASAPAHASTGRLDAWLGPQLAETARRVIGRSFAHASAGSEWPHSYGHRGFDDAEFWREAHAADAAAAASRPAPPVGVPA